jgi:hypothetical protein
MHPAECTRAEKAFVVDQRRRVAQFGEHDACLEEFKDSQKMKAGIRVIFAYWLFVSQRRIRRDNYYHSKTLGRVTWLFSTGRSIKILDFLHGARIDTQALLLRPCWPPRP